MYIPMPFQTMTAIDTHHAATITEGPSADEMRRLQIDEEEGNRTDQQVVFKTPGKVWEIKEIQDILEHPHLADTWWIWATVEIDFRSGIRPAHMEIYVLWSPENLRSCYLVTHRELVDTKGWSERKWRSLR